MTRSLFLFLFLTTLLLRNAYSKQNNTNTLPKTEESVDSLNDSAKSMALDSPRIARFLAREAIDMSSDIGYKEGEANAWARMAMGFHGEGSLDSAIHYFQKSLDFRGKHNLSLGGIAATHARLSNVYDQKGLYMKSLVHRREAVKMRFELKGEKPGSLAIAYDEIGMTFDLIAKREINLKLGEAHEELDSAIHYFKLALPLWESLNDSIYFANECNMLGSMYRTKKEYETSLDYLNRAESILLETAKTDDFSNVFLMDNYLGKGRLHDEMEEFGQAADYHAKALTLAQGLNDTLSQFMLLNNIGENQFYQKNFGEALRFYHQAEAFAPFCQEESRLIKILHSNLSNTYDSLGIAKEALKYHRKATILGDKISRSEDQARLKDAEYGIKITNDFNEAVREKENFKNWLIGGTVTFFVLFGIGIYITNERRKYQNLERMNKEANLKAEFNEERQKLLTRQNDTKGKILKQVGRDLHDDVGASLVAIKREMELLRGQKVEWDEESKDKYDHIFDLVGKTYSQVRRVSKNLKEESTQKSLNNSVSDLVDKLNKREKDLEIILHLEDSMPISLDPKIELEAFRIIQEALNNTVNHAKAERVDLQIMLADSQLSITIEDDGVGFDTTKKRDGIGLKNMEERTRELNGRFTLDTVKGNGTSVFIEIPVTITTPN